MTPISVGLQASTQFGSHKSSLLRENAPPMGPHAVVSTLFAHRKARLLLAVAVFVLTLVALFDWNWFRRPLELIVSHRTEREFRISHLDVDMGLNPIIKLRDVYLANTPWSTSGEPVARIGSLEFSISLRDIADRKILVPHATLSNAFLVLERAADRRKNWSLKPPQRSAEPGLLRIGTVSVDSGILRYIDHGEALDVSVQARARPRTQDADYPMNFAFAGLYRGAAFNGEALTSEVLSLRRSGLEFPIRGHVSAGSTRVSIEGKVADIADIGFIDTTLRITGANLAELYPFLQLPLPASPPYALGGHLVRKGNRYAVEGLNGKIGDSDLAGDATYVEMQPRPLLTATLASKLLNLPDLGPMVGLEAGKHGSPSRRAKSLPGGKLDRGRMMAMDADVAYVATRFKAAAALPVEDLKFSFRLRDGVGRLAPLEMGLAGGRMRAEISIEARDTNALRTTVSADVRGARLEKLLSSMPAFVKGSGAVNAHVRLDGVGNSVAEAAAASSGTVSASIANGRISNLLDAAAGLNGGKAIALLAGGDKQIALNCAGLAFDIREGVGNARVLVLDTAETRMEGSGRFDLTNEKIDVTVVPEPKKPGVLSFRSPMHIRGKLWAPEVAFDKQNIALRTGAAVALALVNPLAALLPLIETGGGAETNCADVLARVEAPQKVEVVAPSNALAGDASVKKP